MTVNGIEVSVKGVDNVSEQEITNYIDYIHEQTSEELERLEISAAQNGSVALDYTLRPPKFERIRRITGYLVGTIDRWNNAKRAEEHDRVKHGLH
jgi:anaerobic ribonucleoside-triphosphate reductase